MKYQFNYQTEAADLWLLSMSTIYRSLVGVCNIIFTVAIIAVAVTFWSEVHMTWRVLMMLGIGLFTVIQPLLIYQRAKKQVAALPQDMVISLDEKGIHVFTNQEQSHIKWQNVKGISPKANMLIIHSSVQHGFMLTNKVLGSEREAVYQYVTSRIKRKN